MPGVKGMVYSRPRQRTVRRKIWQSMRILLRFTIPDLCRTACASQSNVKKFVRNLTIHGYVAKHGDYVSGRKGSYQEFRLVRNIGPDYPTVCDRCGGHIGGPCIKEEQSWSTSKTVT
jgi:hypothetical protein